MFGGADFYRLHHLAGGDDDAADEFGWGAGHRGCGFWGLEGGIFFGKRGAWRIRPGNAGGKIGLLIGLLIGKVALRLLFDKSL